MWPSLTHSPPIVPPIWPEPMTPMRSLVALLVCAGARAGHSAAPNIRAPAAPSTARRSRSMKSCWGIGASLLSGVAINVALSVVL